MVVFWVKCPTNNTVMETGPSFIVSSERLEEQQFELNTSQRVHPTDLASPALGLVGDHDNHYAMATSSYEPQHDKTNKMPCVPSELRLARASTQSDQSLLSVRRKAWVLSFPQSAQRRLWWPGWSESSLCAHAILLVFVMMRLNYAFVWKSSLFKKIIRHDSYNKLFDRMLVYCLFLVVILFCSDTHTRMVYTVCHSICLFWANKKYDNFSNFRTITSIFQLSEFFPFYLFVCLTYGFTSQSTTMVMLRR